MHSRQFHRLTEIWLAQNMTGMKYDWRKVWKDWDWYSLFRLSMFCLIIFQWFKAVLFLRYRIILFYRRHLVVYAFSQPVCILQPVFIPLTNRQTTPRHLARHALLECTWTLTVPCSPSGFWAAGSCVSCIVLWEFVWVRWSVLRCSGSCLLGLNAL